MLRDTEPRSCEGGWGWMSELPDDVSPDTVLWLVKNRNEWLQGERCLTLLDDASITIIKYRYILGIYIIEWHTYAMPWESWQSELREY
jgi:hypothetical protein